MTRRRGTTAKFDMKWHERRTKWRLAVLSRLESWIEEERTRDPSLATWPFDRLKPTIVRRLSKLEEFIGWYGQPEAEPFDVFDAAGLIVWPRQKALRVARTLFGGGVGIAKDLRVDDIALFNMDWFASKVDR